jgi:hypothetical protein
MHPAWQIEDIRYIILQHLEPQELAHLARTCVFLFHIATDELWRTIQSVSSFTHCLPRGYRRRSLEAKDIERLDFYSRKVRDIVLGSDDMKRPTGLPTSFVNKAKLKNAPFDGKTWEDLWTEVAAVRAPDSQFLPYIRKLRVNNATEALLIPLIGIKGSHLSQIYLKYVHRYREAENTIFKFLDGLTDTKNLEYLFVRDGEPDLVSSKLIRDSPLKHLRLDPRVSGGRHQDLHWKYSTLRPEILRKSTLEHLTIGLTRQWFSDGLPPAEEKYLRSLKTLWLDLSTFVPYTHETACANASSDSWTCRCQSCNVPLAKAILGKDCGLRPPTLFLQGLDKPELTLLNIKFPVQVTGQMFIDVLVAAKENCRLENLEELALTGRGWFNSCPECCMLPEPRIKPVDLRRALQMLLRMPKLKVLRLSVAPNFLDTLDLELYETIAAGLPALEKLYLGHAQFATSSEFFGMKFYEKTPLHYLAVFCSLLPNLVEVSIGAVDGLKLEERPCKKWVSPSVKNLVIGHWVGHERQYGQGVSAELADKGLMMYFPNSDLANMGVNRKLSYFSPIG